METWKAIPFAELDATADKWLMVDENGNYLDDSDEAKTKREELLNNLVLQPPLWR